MRNGGCRGFQFLEPTGSRMVMVGDWDSGACNSPNGIRVTRQVGKNEPPLEIPDLTPPMKTTHEHGVLACAYPAV